MLISDKYRVLSWWDITRMTFTGGSVQIGEFGDPIHRVILNGPIDVSKKRIVCRYHTEHVHISDQNRWTTYVDFGNPDSRDDLIKRIQEYEVGRQFESVLGWTRVWDGIFIDVRFFSLPRLIVFKLFHV